MYLYKADDLKKIYGMGDSLYNEISGYVILKNRRVKKNSIKPLRNKTRESQFFYFDPNLISAEEFKKLGFNRYQIQNLIKYREKGGSFTNAGELTKIYGIDTTFLNSIKPWIIIKESTKHNKKDFKPVPQKLIELNSVDSLQLLGLKGIGSVYASRIIKYRNLLGGFSDRKQLLEVYNFPEETYFQIKNTITIDTCGITKLSLNFSDAYSLSKHPYISKELAEKIVAFRNKNGAYNECTDLLRNEILFQEEYDELIPYLKTN